MSQKKVIVIGAGFGGMATAALLAKQGMQVTLIEKNKCLGGRAQAWKQKGFFFDMGPSWYLMPEIFEKYFKVFNKKSSDYYTLKKLDPAYKIFFEKEGALEIPADKKQVFKIFDSIEKGSAKKLEQYLNEAKYKYDTATKDFLYKDYTKISDFFTPKLLISGIRMQLFNSLDSVVSKKFKDHRLKKILEYSTVFLGGSPKNTPALYSLMSHVDLNLGVYYPIGGLYKIVEAFESLCKENKVKIITNDEVIKINTVNNLAKSVLTKKGKLVNADIVLVNADYNYSESKLLDKQSQTYDKSYWEKKVIGPSALLFYLGVDKKLPNLNHHNLFLADNWDKHFKSIFETKKWPNNPSYYVSCPSKTDNSVAPKGKENLFFLVPVAPGLKDTKAIMEKMFNKIILDFEARTGQKISDKLIVKRIFSIKDFQSEYNAYKGTALGLSHTLTQTAIFRPSNKSKKVTNLYYTGSYTHPGVGIPMTIIGAHIISDKIVRENK